MKNIKELTIKEQKSINGGDKFMYYVSYYWGRFVKWADKVFEEGSECAYC